MHEKDHRVINSVGFNTDSVGSERGERGATVCDYDPHGMAVGMKQENKKDNTEQYKE